LKTKQHPTMGPRHRRELGQTTVVAATLTLILCAVAGLGSGCEAQPQATASSQDHPAQLAGEQPDSSDRLGHAACPVSGHDRVTVEQRPAAPVPIPPPAPEAAADRTPAPRLEENAATPRAAETNPAPPVALPLAATVREPPSRPPAAPAHRPKAASPPSDTTARANLPPQHETPQSRPPRIAPHVANPDELVSVNFDNVDIRTVLKTIGELTGINFIPHQNVNGTVTAMSPTSIRLGDIYLYLQSILDVAGYATIEMGNVVKVVPKAEAVKSHTEVRIGADPAAIPETDRIARQIIPLKYADAAEISEIVTPILSPSAQLATYPRTNSLVITDTSANIRHIAQVIQQLDVEGSQEKVLLFPLAHASAQTMSEQVLRILEKSKMMIPPTGRPQAVPTVGNGPRVLPDERTNSLIVVATDQDAATVGQLVQQLDIERPVGMDTVHVVYLKNGDANEVSRSLANALTSMKLTGPAQLAPRIQVTPDASTNALVIVAPPSDFELISQIIAKLDIVREQVQVEVLIVEISDESLRELGVDWATMDNPSADSVRGFGLTNLGPRVNFLSGTAEGLALGAWKSVGGTVKIGAILQAMEKQSGVNILSTPNILASNHRKAKIIVGENRAFVTQSRITETVDPVTPTVIKSFEYKDVGITLEVTPHVSQGGMVRLKIESQFTKLIEDVTSPSSDTPTTAKRSIQTEVAMGSGATVVIGGLIRDDTVKTVKKVPLLGDLPLLGALFQSQSKHTQKTNLMLFITPQVQSTQEDLQKMTDQKQQQMDAAREASH
jgi:general secretion pathway protein D